MLKSLREMSCATDRNMYSRANADKTNPTRDRAQHLCFSPDILKPASNM